MLCDACGALLLRKNQARQSVLRSVIVFKPRLLTTVRQSCMNLRQSEACDPHRISQRCRSAIERRSSISDSEIGSLERGAARQLEDRLAAAWRHNHDILDAACVLRPRIQQIRRHAEAR